MSQDSYYQQPAPQPAQGGPAKPARGAQRWLVPGLALTAVGLVALASCGPGGGSGGGAASNSPPSAGMNAASASVASTAPSPAPVAPACPKVVQPACPAAPPVAAHAAAKPLSARTAAIWSGHRGWRRHGHRSAYAEAARRWDEGRPWPGDRPDGERHGHHEDALMGGPAMGMRGGYRAEEESRFSERSDSSRFESGEGYREEAHGARPCPLDCRGGLPGDWRRGGYRAAGIDERGYLVWPGKVEY